MRRRTPPWWWALLVALLAVVIIAATGSPARAQSDEDASSGSEVDRRVTDVFRRVTDVVRRVESISGDVATAETPDRIEVTLGADVLFEFDQATLTPEAATRIDEVVERLTEDGTGPVAVVGHTDSKGTPSYNDDLSLRRAEAVRNAMATQAGDVTYTVEGRGEDEPIALNENDDGSDNPEGRARNRRVTITFARKG